MSSDPSASPARGDAWLSAIFFAGFAAAIVVALGYPAIARGMPLVVGIFGAVLSAIQFARSMRRLRAMPSRASAPASWAHVAMFAWLVGAVAVVAVSGILAGGALFVTAYLRRRLGESWSSAVLAGLALSAVLHLVLERGFGVYLYEGLIWR